MSSVKEIEVPDIGDFDSVQVIEVLVKTGDVIAAEDAVISLESDKATIEVPSPLGGKVIEMLVKEGDEVSTGSPMMTIKVTETDTNQNIASDGNSFEKKEKSPGDTPTALKNTSQQPQSDQIAPSTTITSSEQEPVVIANENTLAHASPAVRKLARELGVVINQVSGTGRKGRITKDDVKHFVKQHLSINSLKHSAHFDVAPVPDVNFSDYGPTESKPLSRIQKISGKYLHRNWVRIPHVTQHDEADITELEDFRQKHKNEAKQQGFNLTPLAFIVKAMANTLAKFPKFNASLSADQENLIYKKYCHIGIAVDTKDGLVVPVIRDCDKKGIFEISREMSEISVKAREGKLSPKEMQGGCISVSSLGGIGGTAFTPIINAPEVAILGVSRSQIKPIYDGESFQPRLMLPLSLSYDHRVIDGADAARFIVYLSSILSDIRKVLL